MRILFVTRHFGALRNFEWGIEALADRGHEVHLAGLQDDILGGGRLVARLTGRHPTVTAERAPRRPAGADADATWKLRMALDYLRYLEPAYEQAPRLRHRAWERTPRLLLAALQLPGARTGPGLRVVRGALRALERGLPSAAAVRDYLVARQPDVVLLTPLIGLDSPELDYFLDARALGLRTVFCAWSWDNLSTKAFLRAVPNLVTVWNDTQKHEAVELHGVPAERVAVTGAQCFDHWFEATPTRSRDAFCMRVGLPADRPFILYVCSALFRGKPVEAEFVRRWVEAVRRAPELRDVGILVRPHPSRLKEWQRVSLDGLGPVAFWGASPIDEDSRADYFDSLFYSAAVAGLNTSAFIEAAIVGRPVLTILLPEFWENQEGTLHFRYLQSVGGGLLHVARDWETHQIQLAGALADPAAYTERSRRFVEAFVRPWGRTVRGTDLWVRAVESVREQPAAAPAPRPPAWAPAQLAGRAYCAANSVPMLRTLFWDPTQADEERRRAERVRQQHREKQMRRRARVWARRRQLAVLVRDRLMGRLRQLIGARSGG